MDEYGVKKESGFSRTAANLQKKGAYYTDTGMCSRIGKLFKFPEEEVSVLEPSIGDGSAVNAFLAAAGASKAKVFGVELDEVVAASTRADFKERKAGYIIQADFLTGCTIGYASFGACFANPPYGEDLDGERLEKKFLERIYNYLKRGAGLAYVIPYYVLNDRKFVRTLLQRFTVHGAYRFDDNVYAQFQQVVVVAERRKVLDEGPMAERAEEFISSITPVENMPYLPDEVPEEEKLAVPFSPVDGVSQFCTRFFDRKEAGLAVKNSALAEETKRYLRKKEYRPTRVGNPPCPPKKDSLYLAAIAGGGQGYCGSTERGDLHLQRGVVKFVETEEFVPNEQGDGGKLVVHKRAAVSMTVIEQSGQITTLK